MKGLSTLITFQALLSTISGVLISNMSFIGKMGIFFVYRDYAILRSWWKTAILLFAVQLLIIFVLWLSKRIISNLAGTLVAILFFLLIVYGAYITYLDFTTTSHKLMKTEFHMGGYLFWIAAAITCFYFIFAKIKRNFRANTSDVHQEDVSQ